MEAKDNSKRALWTGALFLFTAVLFEVAIHFPYTPKGTSIACDAEQRQRTADYENLRIVSKGDHVEAVLFGDMSCVLRNSDDAVYCTRGEGGGIR